LIGLKKHDYDIQGSKAQSRELGMLTHSPDKINEWVQSLHQRFVGQLAISIELTKGPIVYALQKYSFITLFPINPALLAKYREAFTPSKAKDDPTDAELALDLMLNYPNKIKPLLMQSEQMRKLMYLVEQRRRLVEDKKRFSNRLIYALKKYYPQLLEWFSHRDTDLFCQFINRWPSLQKLKRARPDTIRNFFKKASRRSVPLIEKRIVAIQEAQYITNDLAVIESHQLLAMAVTSQIMTTIKAIKVFDDEISQLFHMLPDATLFESLPSAGACMAPRLMVAFGENRDRFESASQVQMYAGVAPVTVRSGQKNWVHWRWQCSTFLRQFFVEWTSKTVYSSY
jgi:transposase